MTITYSEQFDPGNPGFMLEQERVMRIMRLGAMPPASRILLIWLTKMADPETGLCIASISELAERALVSRSSVFRHLQILEDRGLIKRRTRKGANGGLVPNEFVVLFNFGKGDSQ